MNVTAGVQYPFNPFTGKRDRINTINTVEFARKVSEIFTCDELTAVGDLVRVDSTETFDVVSVTNNTYPDVVLGIVINKPNANECEVLITGKITVTGTSFSTGKVVFVGTSGELTTTKPVTGNLQKMGKALKDGNMYLNISDEKAIQS